MNFKISSLLINCKKENVRVSFSNRISFIYGNAGVGKSTLVNLISYALGNNIVKTQIVEQEILGVSLNVLFNGNLMVLERKMNSNLICLKSADETQYLVAKKKNPTQRSISEFFYSLEGINPVTMLRGNSSKEISVSFSNYMWYSYLRQEELDNTFFYLGENISNLKELASTYVLKTLLEEKEIFETGINKEINRMREKLTVVNNKIYIIKEIISSTQLKNTNLSHEIVRKQREVVRLKNEKKIVFNESEDHKSIILSKDDFKRYSDKQLTLGKYEAEISYLREFLKIQELAQKNILESERLNKRIDYFETIKRDSSNQQYENNIRQLESIFLKCLQDVQFSYIDETDYVKIDRKTLIPAVFTKYNKFKFDYYNLSSGGKKTIFKICFALAVHFYVIQRGLNTLLPQFIIIDTPMKNISEREDNELYDRLYRFFNNLFSKDGVLKDVQLIIIDKELPKVFYNADILCKHLTNETPLIPS